MDPAAPTAPETPAPDVAGETPSAPAVAGAPALWVRLGLAVLALLVVVLLPLRIVPELDLRGRDADLFAIREGLVVLGLVLAIYATSFTRRGWETLAHWRPDGLDAALLIALPVFLAFVGNGTVDRSGDNRASRALPFVMVETGSVDLREFPPGDHYSTMEIDGRVLTSWPMGTPLLALPYAHLALAIVHGDLTYERNWFWGKHFSALLAATSAALLSMAVLGQYGRRAALGCGLVFALATPVLSSASQSMYNYTGELFCVCIALVLLMRESPSRVRAGLAGVAMGWAFFCRPSALITMGVVGLVLLVRNRRVLVAYAGSAAIVVVVVTLFHHVLYDHPLGGYGILAARPGRWGANLAEGFLGNLISAQRGVLVYFPYLVALILTAPWDGRARRLDAWWLGALLLVVANYVTISMYSRWWGGISSVGPRLMSESAPFLALLTLPWWRRFGQLGARRYVVGACLLFAVSAQFLGNYNDRVRLWQRSVGRPAGLSQVDQGPLWSWRGGALMSAVSARPFRRLRPGPAWDHRPERLWRIDLTPVANARYELHPYKPGVEERGARVFDRIDPVKHNEPDALFHFGPRGRPNSLSTWKRPRTPAIPIGGRRVASLHAILTAGGAADLTGELELARWVIAYSDGSEEELPIHLNDDVFAFRNWLRESPVRKDRIYMGYHLDNDVLVHSSWSLGRPEVGIESIRLRPGPGLQEAFAGVNLLALTLELAPPLADETDEADPSEL